MKFISNWIIVNLTEFLLIPRLSLGIEEVDEVEIFEGAENRLTMNQTYTWEFQCKYKLQRYPFDTQVPSSSYITPTSANQECRIKMTVESLSMSTVRLFADQVKVTYCLP